MIRTARPRCVKLTIPVRVLSEDLRRVANPHFATASKPIGTDDIAERWAN